MTFLDSIDFITGDKKVCVVCISLCLLCDVFVSDIRGSFVCISLPLHIHRIAYFSPCVFPRLSGNLFSDSIKASELQRVVRDHAQAFSHETWSVIKVSVSSDGHISQGIVGRRIPQLGHISPFEPSSEISLVECNPIVVEKICSSSSAGRCKCCFGNHGVSFHVCRARIQGNCQTVPSFSEDISQCLVSSCYTELHLCHMTGFVYRKQC